jgi:hypothetical protein
MARGVFVIADIGGYPRFMRVHRINLEHAQYVVALRRAPPSRLRRIIAWLKLAVRSTPYLLGLRKACDGFRNAPNEG